MHAAVVAKKSRALSQGPVFQLFVQMALWDTLGSGMDHHFAPELFAGTSRRVIAAGAGRLPPLLQVVLHLQTSGAILHTLECIQQYALQTWGWHIQTYFMEMPI